MAQPKSGRPTQKRGGKRAHPYSSPGPRPLGDSARANRAQSSSPLPSASSEEVPLARKLQKSDRPTRRELGMPTREEYATVETEYLASLDRRKKTKALISRKMFDDIWAVLHRPHDIEVGSPQFRWWVRKMFKLDARGAGTGLSLETECKVEDGSPLIVVHDGKRVAVKEEIYDILCFCHARTDHGGRDRTATEIRKHYTWVPKELIAGFVRNCPTCICKKTGKYDKSRVVKGEETSEIETRLAGEYGDGTASVSGTESTSTGSQPQLVPLRDLPPGPALGSFPGMSPQYEHHGVFYPMPAMVPWFMPSSGPAAFGPGSGYTPRPPSDPFPGIPSTLPLHCHLLNGATGPPGSQRERVKLPSIHTCGRALQSPAESPKITLPPLSQLLANQQMAPRQPLEALHGNAFPQFRYTDSQGVPQCAQPEMPYYVPQIDPALLPGGVHMLAMVAEATKAREDPQNVTRADW